jgi:peptide-methionine (S)-S-oxide reductase
VVRTRVGYAGGTKRNPNYHSLGDHAETLQIDYDPAQISYERLLDIFWENHDSLQPPWSRQYMAIIFYHNEDQKRLAVKSKEREGTLRKGEIFTEIVPAGEFYLAEDYHQKYRLRNDRDLMTEFNGIYRANLDFVNSTAAARVNGYLDGYGTPEDLERELASLGLSPAAGKRLQAIVGRRGKIGGRC